jgi:hypothetical protein
LTDVLLLLALLALAVKSTYDDSQVRDLEMTDEVSYMIWAARIPERGLPPADYCPLYGTWYHALAQLRHDRVALFYLNTRVLGFLVAASLYVLCRALGGRRLVSLLAAFFVLNSAVVEVYPYPNYLAIIVLALGTALAARWRSWAGAVAGLGLALLTASYVRPEFAISFLAFCLAVLACVAWVVLRHPRKASGLLVATLTELGCAALLLRVIGNPLGGSRSFIAFEQHYAVNVVAAEQLPLNPWGEYERIVTRDFGGAGTLRESWQANPWALLWHAGVNACRTPSVLADLVEVKLDLSRQAWAALRVVLLAALALGAVGLARRLARREEEVEGWSGLRMGLLVLALVLVPAAASALLVAPERHYLMGVSLFLIALLGAGLGSWPRLRGVCAGLERPLPLLGLFVVLLAVTEQGSRVERPGPAGQETSIATTALRAPDGNGATQASLARPNGDFGARSHRTAPQFHGPPAHSARAHDDQEWPVLEFRPAERCRCHRSRSRPGELARVPGRPRVPGVPDRTADRQLCHL